MSPGVRFTDLLSVSICFMGQCLDCFIPNSHQCSGQPQSVKNPSFAGPTAGAFSSDVRQHGYALQRLLALVEVGSPLILLEPVSQ